MKYCKFFIKYRLEGFLICFVFLLDQYSKYLIEKYYKVYETKIIINKIFSLTFVKNSGVAFGFMHNNNFLVLFLIILICLLFLFFMRKDFIKLYFENYNDKIFRFFFSFFLGGALGNIIDRVTRGYVVDFFDFHVWPVFNVADSFIFLAMMYFIYFFVIKNKNN